MRLPRLTTRRLMVLVAGVAVVCGVVVGLLRRSAHYQDIANSHVRDLTPSMADTPRLRWQVELWRKYKHAARYPWLPVPPDPPMPVE